MPIPLRSDFDAVALRGLARKTKDAPQARRLLALASIYEGASRAEAAQIGGVTRQIVRDWVVKFNALGPTGLIDRKPPGLPSKLNDAHRAALVAVIEQGPIPAVHGVVRWRLVDLLQWVWEEFRITISQQTLSRELRALDYRKLSARPRHHAKNEAEVTSFKKPSPPVWRRSRGLRPTASRSRSGSLTRRGSDRRTRSPAGGPDGARAPQRPRTRGPSRPTSSVPSAPLKAKGLVSFCPAAQQRA
jgi:transposase